MKKKVLVILPSPHTITLWAEVNWSLDIDIQRLDPPNEVDCCSRFKILYDEAIEDFIQFPKGTTVIRLPKEGLEMFVL